MLTKEEYLNPRLKQCLREDCALYWDVVLFGEPTDEQLTELQEFLSRHWFTGYSPMIRRSPSSYLAIIKEAGVSEKAILAWLDLGSLSGLKPEAVSKNFLEFEAEQLKEFLGRWDEAYVKAEFDSAVKNMVTE